MKYTLWLTSLFKRRISRRDQFAMSAPPVPAWFEPVKEQIIPPFPDIWMLFGKNSGHPLSRLMRYYYDEERTFSGYPADDLEGIITLEQEINKTIDRYRAKKELNRLEYMLQSIERITLWRYFYADSMLVRSGNGIDYLGYFKIQQFHLYEKINSKNTGDFKFENQLQS